eukprot:scaffold37059_cov30-Tisochrysis_lutea.AAC.1
MKGHREGKVGETREAAAEEELRLEHRVKYSQLRAEVRAKGRGSHARAHCLLRIVPDRLPVRFGAHVLKELLLILLRGLDEEALGHRLGHVVT